MLFLTAAVSCEQSENDTAQVESRDQKTTIFSDYLKQELKLTIPEEEHYYLIVHKAGCQGVIESALMELDQDFIEHKKIAVITSNKQLVDQYFSNKQVEIYYDRTIDVVNLPLFNVSLIKTNKAQVSYILSERKCSIDFGKTIADTLRNALP